MFESGKADIGAGLFVNFMERSESEGTLCIYSSKNEHDLQFIKNTNFINNNLLFMQVEPSIQNKNSYGHLLALDIFHSLTALLSTIM